MTDPSLPQLRFLCFGAGAIGTYLGGSLALAGHSVVFFERPEPARLLREKGLTIWQGEKATRVPSPQVVDHIDDVLTHGPYDVAILAVKAYDTLALAESLHPYRVALPPVICFQNGVENEAVIAEHLGSDKVISGTITTAIGRRGPGEIVVERLRGIGIANEHILAPTLVAVMDHAGLRARMYDQAAAMKWSKMLTNLLGNASSAILDMPPSQIFAHPGLFRMEMLMLREAIRVMQAQDIPVIDLPETPVRALAWSVNHLPLFLNRLLLGRVLAGGRGDKMPSFHIDFHAGRGKSEVDYLNGAVVRFGRRLGILTPVNSLLTDTLLALTAGKISPDRFAHKPDQLLKLLP
jgi:2-dehydropantoate 2-reductase